MNSPIRPRRLRRTDSIRKMVREVKVHPEDFIYPLFVHEDEAPLSGENVKST